MTENLPNQFTIRIYGLLAHENQILLSRENIKGEIHTKFPGGGLEFGEGIIDCLKREFMEEVSITLSETELFYVTEDYFASAFHKSSQVVSIYYQVKTTEVLRIKTGEPENDSLLQKDEDQVLYWCPLAQLAQEPVELPIDKIVVRKLLSED